MVRSDHLRNFILCLLAGAVIVYLAFLRVELAGRSKTVPPAPEEEPAPEAPPVNCRLGEKIAYDIRLGKLKVGESVFENLGRSKVGGREAVQVVFQTRLPRFSDTETIHADIESFLPLRVQRDVAIWPKREQIVEDYDQQSYRLTITRRNGKTDLIEKKGPLHNAILLPYQVRCFGAIEPGWSMPVTLPTQDFQIFLRRIEEVSVPAGTFKAYYFESVPERFAIWVSADERRLPVKIKGSGGIGYVMVMKSFE